MLLQRKALYNLLQLNLARIESGELKISDLQQWQIADYRTKHTEELFHQLHALGVTLDAETFAQFEVQFEEPEELVQKFAKGRTPLEQDEIFLIFFELWRRFFPEKRTISIFCDELDYQMMAYDLEKPHQIVDTLVYLQQLLDEHVDRGLKPIQALQLIQIYCAGDIESFLFDYILDVIDLDNYNYAIELLEGFKRYAKDPIWFDYLEARAEIVKYPEEGYEKLEKVVEHFSITTKLELVEEALFFLAPSGNHTLFYHLAKKTLSWLKKEEDFQEFLEACYSHYDYLELKLPALEIAQLFYSRSTLAPHQPLSQNDPAVGQIRTILDQKVHFAEE